MHYDDQNCGAGMASNCIIHKFDEGLQGAASFKCFASFQDIKKFENIHIFKKFTFKAKLFLRLNCIKRPYKNDRIKNEPYEK
jgi:hypothetical protein